jgi:hypothetical protein
MVSRFSKNLLPMIRIAISVEAFEAIARTLPLGSVGYENEVNERGERYVWLEPTVVNRLRAMRRGGRELQRRDHADRGAGGACHSTRVRPSCPLARDRLAPDTSDFSVPASRARP